MWVRGGHHGARTWAGLGSTARGVPLLEQFVYDLGDPVIDRVAEAGQEFLVRRRVCVEPGRAAGWR
jgi:hypothetical protein